MVTLRLCAKDGCGYPAVHGAFCVSCQRERVVPLMGSIAWDDRGNWEDDEPVTVDCGA